jgi:hypothetical protein
MASHWLPLEGISGGKAYATKITEYGTRLTVHLKIGKQNEKVST